MQTKGSQSVLTGTFFNYITDTKIHIILNLPKLPYQGSWYWCRGRTDHRQCASGRH